MCLIGKRDKTFNFPATQASISRYILFTIFIFFLFWLYFYVGILIAILDYFQQMQLILKILCLFCDTASDWARPAFPHFCLADTKSNESWLQKWIISLGLFHQRTISMTPTLSCSLRNTPVVKLLRLKGSYSSRNCSRNTSRTLCNTNTQLGLNLSCCCQHRKICITWFRSRITITPK